MSHGTSMCRERSANTPTRRSIAVTIIVGIAVLSIQCRAAHRDRGADGQALTIMIPNQDERVLGPLGANPWFLVFLGLASGDENATQHVPRLLDRWTHTPDYRAWTVHVRDGVRWDDGVPVTASDVKFSLELWTDKRVLYEFPFFDTLTVLDSNTLHITFKRPVSGTIFTYDWLPIVPKHLLDTLDVAQLFDWPFWTRPVGDGPFRYVRHTAGTMTELAANPSYYGAGPRIATVVLRYGGNAITELLSGEVDVASNVTPLEAVRLRMDPRFRVYHRVQYGHPTALAWNDREPLFRDAAVRRALTMAIDRRELDRVLNYPEDIAIVDVPILDRHHREGNVPAPLPFAPERAKHMLAAAGWNDGNGDGMLERDGRPFRFTLSVTQRERAEAIYVQDQLKKIGVDVQIATYDRGELTARQHHSKFDATIFTYNYIEQFGTFPLTGYKNATISALRDSAWFSIDHDRSDRYMRSLWRIFSEQVPVTFLHPEVTFFAARKEVRGLADNMDLFRHVATLWIEQ